MLARLILGTMLISLSVFVSPAQTSSVKTPACDEDFARFLVDQQVSESRNVEQTDKRIRILIRAAEFLWKVEEPLAREYFTEAFKVADARFHEKGSDQIEKVKGQTTTTLSPDYRYEVIRAVSAKDPAWAKKLIERVIKEYEKDSDGKGFLDKQRELAEIMRVGQESINTNPEFSRFLFRRVMQEPLDYHWYFLLFSIANEHRPFADDLYNELLANYANATPRRLLFLSAYPFANGRIFGPDKYQFGVPTADGLTPNRNLQRRFITTFLQRVLSFAADPQNLNLPPEEYRQPEPVYMIRALSELEPIVVQSFPEFIQQHSEAKAQATGMLSEQMRKDMSDRERENESLGYGFERRLKQLEEAETNGKLTDSMIVSLLTWGEQAKTEEQFKQIEPWLAKIREESPRNESTNYFWFVRAKLAANENRIDEAQRFAKKIPEIEQRAIVFFELAALQLKDVSDAATVYQTLRDVGKLAEQSETSIEKARVLIALSNQYIKINPTFAIQELADAIRVINQLENPDILSTSIFRQIRGKTFIHSVGFSLPGQNLEGTFKEISKGNFELSLSNAKSIDDKYLRTLAVFAVAQNCVGQPKKKPASKQPAIKRAN